MPVRFITTTRAATFALILVFAHLGCHLLRKAEAPATPAAPSGPSSGLPDSTCSFAASTTDPNGDSLQYQFDWGDGNKSRWSSLVPNGTSVTMSYAWSAAGTYSVTARALNTKQITSDWSPAHSVTVGTKGGD